MFFFIFHAIPTSQVKSKSRFKKVKGSYINVWVNYPDKTGAEALARFYIKKSGWKYIRQSGQANWISHKLKKNDVNYPYYQEALKHGSSLVFHLYSENK